MLSKEEQRQSVVFVALFEYHNQVFGKDGKPAKPPDTTKYFRRMGWKGSFKGISWCGIFDGYCISEGLMNQERPIDWLQWVPRVGLNPGPQQIPKDQGKPGDIAWFVKNQHYALIEKPLTVVAGSPVVYETVEGNQPAILRKRRTLGEIHSVYSIEEWLV